MISRRSFFGAALVPLVPAASGTITDEFVNEVTYRFMPANLYWVKVPHRGRWYRSTNYKNGFIVELVEDGHTSLVTFKEFA